MRAEAKYQNTINGHTLSGVKHGGRWAWACASWPDLVDAHNGCADGTACIDEFERRALGGEVPGDQQKASA